MKSLDPPGTHVSWRGPVLALVAVALLSATLGGASTATTLHDSASASGVIRVSGDFGHHPGSPSQDHASHPGHGVCGHDRRRGGARDRRVRVSFHGPDVTDRIVDVHLTDGTGPSRRARCSGHDIVWFPRTAVERVANESNGSLVFRVFARTVDGRTIVTTNPVPAGDRSPSLGDRRGRHGGARSANQSVETAPNATSAAEVASANGTAGDGTNATASINGTTPNASPTSSANASNQNTTADAYSPDTSTNASTTSTTGARPSTNGTRDGRSATGTAGNASNNRTTVNSSIGGTPNAGPTGTNRSETTSSDSAGGSNASSPSSNSTRAGMTPNDLATLPVAVAADGRPRSTSSRSKP